MHEEKLIKAEKKAIIKGVLIQSAQKIGKGLGLQKSPG